MAHPLTIGEAAKTSGVAAKTRLVLDNPRHEDALCSGENGPYIRFD